MKAKMMILALAAVACGDDVDPVTTVGDLEDDGPQVAQLEQPPHTGPKVRVFEATCDYSYVTRGENGEPRSNPVALFSVPWSTVRIAWACDELPGEVAAPWECEGVAPSITRDGNVLVPCVGEGGREYGSARLLIELP